MVRIPLDGFRTARYFGGVILLLLAAAMLWATRGTSEMWMGAAMLAVAIAILAWRRYLEVDTQRKRLALRVGIFGGFVTRAFHLDVVRRLALKPVTFRDERGSKKTRYAICIGGIGGSQLCDFSDMWRARAITERLSRALSVDTQNRLLGGSSTRAATELDLSLAERWHLEGGHKEAPRLPPDSVLRMELRDDYSELSAPIEMPLPRPALIGLSVVVLSFLGALFLVLEDARVFLSIVGVGAISILGVAIARTVGRDRIRFDAQSVTLYRGRWLPQRLRLSEIEEILSNRTEVVLMSDRRHLKLRKPAAEADADLQRQFIERQVARRHRVREPQ